MYANTMNHSRGGTIFSEEQYFTGTWAWPAMLVAAAGAWAVFLYQIAWKSAALVRTSDKIGAWVLLAVVGVLLPWLFRYLRLICTLTSDRIDIDYRPLMRTSVMLSDIAGCEARTYQPIREYGGWGIRWGGRGSVAYNVSGNRGVQLELKNGKRVLLGSQRADEFARAIRTAAGLQDR
jgi:hypothetical protein